MNPGWDQLWLNCDIATMRPAHGDPLGTVRDGAMAIADGRIAWLGPRAELPASPSDLASRVEDANGAWLLPGLIDCHTHTVFAGNRYREFERRLNGERYEQIAAEGGGIRSTVASTAAATVEELVEQSAARVRVLVRSGVTTLEIKSGYGLETEAELRMLRAARQLGMRAGPRVHTTFLGLHALPEQYGSRRHAYVEDICETALPAVAEEGLADSVDAFCEAIAFTESEVESLFLAAAAFELPVRLHADQLSDQNGAALAARHGALSADHLEYSSEAGVRAMAQAGSVAVLLPGAFYSLGEHRKPPVAWLREYGVPIAIATDLNPGSSPLLSAPLAMNMACTLFGLTTTEALAGMTSVAARALGLEHETGSLARGMSADFGIWRVEHPAELCYWIGATGPERSFLAGREFDLR